MNSIAHRIVASLVVVGGAALAGCAHEQVLPPAAAPPPVAVTQTTSQVLPTRVGVNVSAEILKACEIDVNNADTAPKFDFDKSELRPGDRVLLEKVETCVTSGPLQGRSLRLVGRADPRGELEYNFALGTARAGSVDAYLTTLGLDSTRVSTSSRGKLDATGTDETGWQRDRRVNVDLL